MSALILKFGLGVYGGGERYAFALADAISAAHDVVIASNRVPDRAELQRRGFPTEYEIRSIELADRKRISREFDLVIQFRMAPPTHPIESARSVTVVQFPSRSLATLRRPRAYYRQKRAMRSVDTFITYSEYCAAWTERRWRRKSFVVYPPVRMSSRSGKSGQGILSIGRFEPTKCQGALIAAYKALPRDVQLDWPLHLVGGSLTSDRGIAYLENLVLNADGHNIHFHPNASEATVKQLFECSAIYWHAKGLDRRPGSPELAEHFGIAVVEAMSHGLVPLVVDDGGLPEIVKSGTGGLWKSVDDLVESTQRLIEDENERRRLAAGAVLRSAEFSTEAFNARVRSLLL